jgi:hypothetical protein
MKNFDVWQLVKHQYSHNGELPLALSSVPHIRSPAPSFIKQSILMINIYQFYYKMLYYMYITENMYMFFIIKRFCKIWKTLTFDNLSNINTVITVSSRWLLALFRTSDSRRRLYWIKAFKMKIYINIIIKCFIICI